LPPGTFRIYSVIVRSLPNPLRRPLEKGWLFLATIVSIAAICGVLQFEGASGQTKLRTPPTRTAGQVTFAQLTDAHIFDDGYRQATAAALRQAADDRQALHWAVDQVNRAVASGTALDFVVYTGDLGLQNVSMPQEPDCGALAATPDPGLPQTTLAWAVSEISGEIRELAVRRVFFVAGNNDLRDEEVTDRRFDCFVARLQTELNARKDQHEIIALHADRAVDVNGVRISGLNSASFKAQKNYVPACKQRAEPGCPQPQIEALGRLARDKTPLLVFTHVPDLRDPYRRGPSWDLPPATQALWQRFVCGSPVIGVFAGHFHDSNQDLYGNNSKTKDLSISDCVTAKTWVAPPLALKNQERTLSRARGFLIATVAAGKVSEVRVQWFENSGAPATLYKVAVENSPAPSTPTSSLPASALIAPAVVLLIALLVALITRKGDRSMKFSDLSGFCFAVVFFFLGLGGVWWAKQQFGVTEAPILIALLVCPLLVYGVASGRITEFSAPGGWAAKFAQEPIGQGSLTSSPIDFEKALEIPKAGLAKTLGDIHEIRENKPVVLTVTLPAIPGPHFSSAAFGSALKSLSEFPNFRFVAFLSSDGRLISYIPGWQLKPAMNENSGEGEQLIGAVNRGDEQAVRNYSGMLTKTVTPLTSNAAALEAMEEAKTDAIAVVEPADGKLLGVVARTQILSRMLLALARYAKA
jgi:hypothetical protein